MKSNLLFAALLVVFTLSGSIGAAYGPIYMNYEGIDGDVTAQGHEKWIELSSLQFKVGREISVPTPANPEREASAPSVSEIVVTKVMDRSSVPLFMEALIGHPKEVMIHFVETAKNKQELYYTIELENTLISGYSISSGGDRPTESVSMSFTKISKQYTPFDKKGVPEPPFRGSYDLTTGQQ